MHSRVTRRMAIALTSAALLGAAVPAALAQSTHMGGQGGRGGGSGHTPGGGHTPGAGDDDHSHDDSEHTDDDHEHEEHDPDAGTDHADGKRGPRYRGGRTSTQVLGRGYGRSLEDRVLSAD